MDGNQPVIRSNGPVDENSAKGPAKAFIARESAAREFKNATVVPASHSEAARAMMTSGFALVRANCYDFFNSAGKNQQWLLFSRDSVAAVGTLAAGVIGLRGGHANAAGNIALLTGATFSGMDIYTKNFLFSAENISAVNELIIKALDTHSAAIDPMQVLTYDDASDAIYDNQSICAPMKIAALSREAIQKGVVVPVATTQASDGVDAAIDELAYDKLGELLQPPASLTFSQATALWWLFKSSSTETQRRLAILPQLAGIDPEKLPIDKDGNFKAGRDFGPIKRVLNTFSAGTKASFASKIAAAPKPAEPSKNAPPIGSPMPVPTEKYIPPVFEAPEAGRSKSIRVRVGIQ